MQNSANLNSLFPRNKKHKQNKQKNLSLLLFFLMVCIPLLVQDLFLCLSRALCIAFPFNTPVLLIEKAETIEH